MTVKNNFLHRSDKHLLWHVVLILILKVVVLTALWHAFIKPNRVKVDAAAMEKKLISTSPSVPGKNHD